VTRYAINRRLKAKLKLLGNYVQWFQVCREILTTGKHAKEGIELISEILNKEKMNVIKFAIHRRALKVAEELLNFTDVLRVDGFEETVYDVTDLVPDKEKNILLTISSTGCKVSPEPSGNEKKSRKDEQGVSSTDSALTNNTEEQSNVEQSRQPTEQTEKTTKETSQCEDGTEKTSCMELIIELLSDRKTENESAVANLFESNSVKLFVKNTYWKLRLVWSCLADLSSHHMILFAVYALPNAKELAVQSSCVRLPSSKGPKVFGFGQRF
jgi:hypothetical protein